MGSHMLHFPKEIIRNILKRLPVKSLIRFQCVCKDWNNLIKNQSFISDHLQQYSHQNPSLLFKHYYELYLLDGSLEVRHIRFIDSLKGASIVGSCNGLLCLEVDQDYGLPPLISLWNPATTDVRDLPQTIIDSEFVAGFGFSEVVNDYMIVRACLDFDDDPDDQVVEVLWLSTGTWQAIDVGNLKYVNLYPGTVTINGAIFWLGEKFRGKDEEGEDNIEVEEGEDEFQVIVSFDILKEVFTVIPRPHLDHIANEKLTVYEDKLALLCMIRENNYETPWIDLWVLDGGAGPSGKKWSWTKRYSSSPFRCTMDSIAIWGNKIVCNPNYEEDIENERNVLCLTNIATNEIKRFDIPYCGRYHNIYNYVESLVRVGYNYMESLGLSDEYSD